MSQQIGNTSQAIADLIFEKWSIENPQELKKDKILCVGFVHHPDQRFQGGKEIIVEVDNISGTATPTSKFITPIRDLYKIDLWVRVADTSQEARVRHENNRAIIKDQIMRIIHNNQTAIPGLKFAGLTRFARQDEPENDILHSIVYITGQWFHLDK